MGELGLLLSGEMLLRLPLLLSGERRCLTFTLPGSAAPPVPGGEATAAVKAVAVPAARASGGVELDGGGLLLLPLPPPPPPPPRGPPGPVLLPTEAEVAGERVGLCWLPRRSWYGTVARIGWSSRLVPALPPGAPPTPLPPAAPPAPLLPTGTPALLPPPQLLVGEPAVPRRIL